MRKQTCWPTWQVGNLPTNKQTNIFSMTPYHCILDINKSVHIHPLIAITEITPFEYVSFDWSLHAMNRDGDYAEADGASLA